MLSPLSDNTNALASSTNQTASTVVSNQGTIAASGKDPNGHVLAILCQNGAQQPGARNFNVLVGGANGLTYSPDQVEAEPGDTVSFIFGDSNHTVTQSTSFTNPCQHTEGDASSGFVPSQNVLDTVDTTGSPILQYTVNSTDAQFFFCGQADHCAQGMVFAINAATNESMTQLKVNAANLAVIADDSIDSSVSDSSTQTITATITLDLLGSTINTALLQPTAVIGSDATITEDTLSATITPVATSSDVLSASSTSTFIAFATLFPNATTSDLASTLVESSTVDNALSATAALSATSTTLALATFFSATTSLDTSSGRDLSSTVSDAVSSATATSIDASSTITTAIATATDVSSADSTSTATDVSSDTASATTSLTTATDTAADNAADAATINAISNAVVVGNLDVDGANQECIAPVNGMADNNVGGCFSVLSKTSAEALQSLAIDTSTVNATDASLSNGTSTSSDASGSSLTLLNIDAVRANNLTRRSFRRTSRHVPI